MDLYDLTQNTRNPKDYPYLLYVDDVEVEEVSSDGQEVELEDVVTVIVPVTKEEIIEFINSNQDRPVEVYERETMKDVTDQFKADKGVNS
ncbi:MAG: hypothetical protein QW046_06265 [Candidatus Micrarchaeaceae archaeon]